jgi:hypothetical protein
VNDRPPLQENPGKWMGTCRGNQSDQLASRVSAPNRVQLVKYAPGPRHFGDSSSIDRRRISTDTRREAHQSDALGGRGVLRCEALAESAWNCHVSIWALAFVKHTSLYSRLPSCTVPLYRHLSHSFRISSNNVPFIFVCQRCGAGCFCSSIFASP